MTVDCKLPGRQKNMGNLKGFFVGIPAPQNVSMFPGGDVTIASWEGGCSHPNV